MSNDRFILQSQAIKCALQCFVNKHITTFYVFCAKCAKSFYSFPLRFNDLILHENFFYAMIASKLFKVMTTSESATPSDKLDFKRILPIIAIVLVDLIGLSIIIPLMPLFATRFGADPFIIGILQATYPAMQFIGTPILGRLSDRFGRKPIFYSASSER